MELVFQKLSLEALSPKPGEIILVPAAAEHRQRRDLASLVLENGPQALLQGPGEPEQIVINADPTLDDMLAASILMRKLQGQQLPEGCRAFAHYAALVREGLRPGQFPLEQSMEGIFLAVRGKAEQDLTVLGDQETAQIFASVWERMAAVIFKAAEEGKDPFTTPLFASGPEFARERAFLTKDLDVYRHDFSQGEPWQVQLPGGPVRALGLFLQRPKSLLFKYWSRMECPAPLGGPYLFLAVNWGNGQWVFSTDPVQKLSLKPLANLLQGAEDKLATSKPATELWFDGRPFQHTLVASPRNGSRLPDKTVVRLVKKWARARQLPRSSVLPYAAAILLACLIGGGLLLAILRRPEPPPSPPDLRALYKKVAPAVVMVRTPKDNGTGFLISLDGWIITNEHVIRLARPDPQSGARQATIVFGKLIDGEMKIQEESATSALIYKEDPRRDLALLKLTTRQAEPLPFLVVTGMQASREIVTGLDCLAIGNMWTMKKGGGVSRVYQWPGEDPRILNLVRTEKEKAQLRQILAKLQRKIILSNCDLQPGDSGGPLIDNAGDVIGVSFALPLKKDASLLGNLTMHVHLDELNEFLKDRPIAPIPAARPSLPNRWPGAFLPELAEHFTARGVCCQINFLDAKKKIPVGCWLDFCEQNDELAPEDLNKADNVVVKMQWKFQFACKVGALPTAYYATKGQADIDLIVQTPSSDSEIPDVKWRRQGVDWVLEAVNENYPLISEKWFGSEKLQTDFQEKREKMEKSWKTWQATWKEMQDKNAP